MGIRAAGAMVQNNIFLIRFAFRFQRSMAALKMAPCGDRRFQSSFSMWSSSFRLASRILYILKILKLIQVIGFFMLSCSRDEGCAGNAQLALCRHNLRAVWKVRSGG